MTAEKNLEKLLRNMQPKHNPGDYVFCALDDISGIHIREAIMLFKETEAITIIVKKEMADQLRLDYSLIASWITLTVHSSLAAVGLTAAFSGALAEAGISCNVVAAFYHDHIFVDKRDTEKTMEILNSFSNKK